jgi:tetratricopeptide (TPR) repeat protein
MNTSFATLIFLFAVSTVQPVFADQTDTELDSLFTELKSSPNSKEASPIAERIWAIWMKTDDHATTELLEQGMIEVGRGDLEAGRDIFTQVTQRSPNFAEGWNKLATVNYMMGDIESSLKNIEETLKREPRHFGSISGRGLCYLKQRRWQSALIEFKAALDVHPWMLDARRNLKLLENNLENHSI